MRSLRQQSLIILALLIAAPFAQATEPSPAELAFHKAEVRKANELLNGMVAEELNGLRKALPKRGLPGGPPPDFDIHIPSAKTIRAKLRPQTLEEIERDRKTFELVQEYYAHQGDDRYTGSFLESTSTGNWNTQRWVGWHVAEIRRQLLDQAKADGNLNIRFGVNLGDINPTRPETVEPVVAACDDMWARGMSPTLSTLFFPKMSQWAELDDQRRLDALKSHLMNPRFPEEVGRLAQFVLHHVKLAADRFNAENDKKPPGERLPRARVAVNPVNEAETLVAFLGQFWHGALAKWNDPNVMNIYVPSSINLALASVEIRRAVYKVFGQERVLLVENPAMTDRNYFSHQGDLQMFVNEMMLGTDSLMKADFERLRSESIEDLKKRFAEEKAQGRINVIDAAIVKYVDCPVNSERPVEARARLISEFQHLRRAHLAYQEFSGKTASTDTMLMFDYYQQSELILPKPVPETIRDLAADGGAGLKEMLGVKNEEGVFNVLRESAHEAERWSSQKLWHDYRSLKDIDLVQFLSQEDAIVLDKVLGLRNEWSLRPNPEFAERRERAGWKMSEFDNYKGRGSDEHRDDGFLDRLLENDAALLKHALGANDERELRAKLRDAGRDTQYGGDVVEFSDEEPLRSVLNKDERRILHRAFGFRRMRRSGFLTPHMARQNRSGVHEGFGLMSIRYMNALGIRIGGVGEWGTPFPWVALTIRHMRAELVAVAHEANFYIVRFDGGALVTPIGWMGGPVTGTLVTNRRRGADGIYKFVWDGKNISYVLNSWENNTPFFIEYRDHLKSGLQRQREKIAVKVQRVAPSCSALLDKGA